MTRPTTRAEVGATSSAPIGWVPKPGAVKPVETQVMAALSTVKPEVDRALTEAVAKVLPQAALEVRPTDLLKQVRNADLDLRLPLKAQDLYQGPLGIELARALEHTTVSMKCQVKNGTVDFEHAKLTFDPPLQGPLWVKVPAVSVREGKVTLQLSGFPDLNVGPTLPANLEGLAQTLERLQQSSRVSAGVLGLNLAQVKTPSELASSTTTQGALDTVGQLVDGARSSEAQLSMKNVSFNGGRIALGGLGSVDLQPGSTVSVHGSLDDLAVTGHVGFSKLSVARDGLAVSGGHGSADLSLRLQRHGDHGSVETSLDRLDLALDSAVSQRTNGDVLALGHGSIKGGSLQFRTALTGQGLLPDQPGRASLQQLHLDQFEGTLTGARITIPDAKDTAQVRVAQATMKGSLDIDADRILVTGSLSNVKAEVSDYQGGAPGASMDLRTIAVSGGGTVRVDSQQGLSLSGAVQLEADIASGQVGSGKTGVATQLDDGSRVAMTAKRLEVNSTSVRASGSAEVDLKLSALKLGAVGVAFEAREAAVRGSIAQATLDTSRGLELVKSGPMTMNATLSGGHISFGSGVKVALAGAQLHTALTRAAFDGDHLTAELAKGTSLDAVLASGSVQLRGSAGQPVGLQLGAGSTAHFDFDQLSYDSAGTPVAKGRLELSAKLDGQRVSLPDIEALTGVQLDPASISRAALKVRSEFAVHADRTFELDHASVALQTELEKVTGTLQ